MSDADKILETKMVATYKPMVDAFFADLSKEGFTQEELEAVPAMLLPCWGEGYSTSVLKIAVVGKETLRWKTDFGDSLFADVKAMGEGKYSPLSSCKRYRDQGPAEWWNIFWQYAAEAIGRIFGQRMKEMLVKDNSVLNSIAWFNSHVIETYQSTSVQANKTHITPERMQSIQKLTDNHGLCSFDTFVDVFEPNVIFYFYRDSSGDSLRNLLGENSNCEYVRSYGEQNAIDVYQLGDTVILQMRHPTWMVRGNMTKERCAELIYEALKSLGDAHIVLPQTIGKHYNVRTMSAIEWRTWVDVVRREALKYLDQNNFELSRHLILMVARELSKIQSTMTAQTMVLLLNEVIKFRNDNWLYSPERRGPCSTIRGAFWTYENEGKNNDASLIAHAFTKMDGSLAWK